MAINADDVPIITGLLSQERLSGLIALTGCPYTAIELHQETLRLGASLMNVIATIEISLRNSVAENLSAYFGVSNWVQQPPVALNWKEPERKKIKDAIDSARRAEYSKLSQAEKAKLDILAYPKGRPPNTSHKKRAQNRRRYIPVTDGKVIAELTLYFWKRLYSPEYEQALWRTTLKRSFPDKTIRRADVAAHLEHIYQARNRLAHHEAVMHRRFYDTMQSIRFVTRQLGVHANCETTPLALLLKEEIDLVCYQEAELNARINTYRARCE